MNALSYTLCPRSLRLGHAYSNYRTIQLALSYDWNLHNLNEKANFKRPWVREGHKRTTLVSKDWMLSHR